MTESRAAPGCSAGRVRQTLQRRAADEAAVDEVAQVGQRGLAQRVAGVENDVFLRRVEVVGRGVGVGRNLHIGDFVDVGTVGGGDGDLRTVLGMLKIAEEGRRVSGHQNCTALAGDFAARVDARARVQLGILVAIVQRAVHRRAGDFDFAQSVPRTGVAAEIIDVHRRRLRRCRGGLGGLGGVVRSCRIDGGRQRSVHAGALGRARQAVPGANQNQQCHANCGHTKNKRKNNVLPLAV